MLLGHRVIQVACGSRDAQTLALTDEGKITLPQGQARITLMMFVIMYIWFFLSSTFQFVVCDILHVYLSIFFSGLVFSWGDGDFGKLGRGGSEGCNIPQNIERLNGQGVCQIECGAQFSLALTKSGVVWTWYDGVMSTNDFFLFYQDSLVFSFQSGEKETISDWATAPMCTCENPRWWRV